MRGKYLLEANASAQTPPSAKPSPGRTASESPALASNTAFGRNFAGIHWRSDGLEGLKLGEEVAIRVLEELAYTGNELFAGWSLKRFDGSRVKVG